MSSIMSEKVFEDQLELFFDNSNSDIMVLVSIDSNVYIIYHIRIYMCIYHTIYTVPHNIL